MGKIMNIIHKGISFKKNEVGKKTADFFSLIHIACGLFAFLIISFIISFFPLLKSEIILFTSITVFYLAVIWEIFENYILFKTRFKFNKEKDELINSLFDIIFTNIGAFLALFLTDMEIIIIILNLFVFAYVWKIETK